jgi:hypothetical protein
MATRRRRTILVVAASPPAVLDQRTKRALLVIGENYDELAEPTEAVINSKKPPV